MTTSKKKFFQCSLNAFLFPFPNAKFRGSEGSKNQVLWVEEEGSKTLGYPLQAGTQALQQQTH